MSNQKLYPMRFKEILRNYGFGNRWITREFAKSDLPDNHRIAETWEVCDRPGESSEITNGWMRGKSLSHAIGEHGVSLLGRAVVQQFGNRFPLLIKLLDASNTLTEQLHPSDKVVVTRNLNDLSGKTEAWYMLRTGRNSTILCGHKPELTTDQLRQALIDDRSKECMLEYTAEVGDGFLLHAGTMHYAEGGVLFYEIMQNSDITTVLRPNDKTANRGAWADDILETVHFEDSLGCKTRPVSVEVGANRRTWLIVCTYFAVERLDLKDVYQMEMDGERFHFLTVINGSANVNWADGSEQLDSGMSCLLPADLGDVVIEPNRKAAVLVAYVPDLAKNVVAPLRSFGIADADIRGLGGSSVLNALNELTGG